MGSFYIKNKMIKKYIKYYNIPIYNMIKPQKLIYRGITIFIELKEYRMGNQYMKKIFISFMMIIFIFSGCISKKEDTKYISKDKAQVAINDEIKDKNLLKEYDVSLGTKGERKLINEIIKIKEIAVKEKDIKKYMKTINESDKEYYSEQRHWFEDIQASDIENYTLEVKGYTKIDNSTFLVALEQKYRFNNMNYDLEFKQVYKKTSDGIKDCDLNFKIKQTEHFIIKYFDDFEDKIDEFSKGAEKAYDIVLTNYGKVPNDKTVIKLYNDVELLRQSVKLSFAWNFSGWYEYPESIKYMENKGLSSEFFRGIAHEIIHKVTIKQTNNNMPYWFGEGLAEYFSLHENVRNRMRSNKSIKELQKINLERLKDFNEVRDYYVSSTCLVIFIVDKYGKNKLENIIDELGKYPLQEKVIGEIYKENQKTFADVLSKVLGITIEELDEQWKEYLEV